MDARVRPGHDAQNVARGCASKAPPPVFFAAPGAPSRLSRSSLDTQGRAERRALSLPAALRDNAKKSHRLSHHGKPKTSALRARCLRLAPCSPPVEIPFLSTARAGRSDRRDATAWASAAGRTSCAPQRPPLPAPRLVTLMKRPLVTGRDAWSMAGEDGGIMNKILDRFQASWPGRGTPPTLSAGTPLSRPSTSYFLVIAGQPGPAFGRPGCRLVPAIHEAHPQFRR
jgi:hypothetical protein